MPKSPVARAIGERLAKARERAGMTQQELATALNVALPTYRHYEKGRHLLPTDLLRKVSEVLHMPVGYFLSMPDPCGLEDDERYLVESYRDITTAVLRAGVINHVQQQVEVDRDIRGRTGQSQHVGFAAPTSQ